MNKNQFYSPEDYSDMEIPEADDISNIIVGGLMLATILFAIVGFLGCILLAFGVLKF